MKNREPQIGWTVKAYSPDYSRDTSSLYSGLEGQGYTPQEAKQDLVEKIEERESFRQGELDALEKVRVALKDSFEDLPF